VLNDKEFGGVFISRDAGQTWKQTSDGLDGRDVFVLRQTTDNSLIAGTDHGIFALKPNASRWTPRNVLLPGKTEPTPAKKTAARSTVPNDLSARISVLEFAGERWFAATSTGLFVSPDAGETWKQESLPGAGAPISISVAGKVVAVADRNTVAVSVSGGESWLPFKPLGPEFVINAVAVDSSGDIWLAARAGLFRSTDAGDTWKPVSSLRLANILTVQFDEENRRVLVTSGSSTNVFESGDNGRTWSAISAGWRVRNLRLARGRLLGTTAFDGVVVQPEITAATGSVSGNGTR
ncbi:MAG: hypothetical protein ACHP79_18785, partial [Terriglobales bacterium]